MPKYKLSGKWLLVIVWIAIMLLFAVLGICAQLVFWYHGGRSLLGAIIHAWPLWLVYLLIAVIIGERIYRWLSGKFTISGQ